MSIALEAKVTTLADALNHTLDTCAKLAEACAQLSSDSAKLASECAKLEQRIAVLEQTAQRKPGPKPKDSNG